MLDHARDRLSLVAHAAMPLMSPLAVEELDALLDGADLDGPVLDLCGGRGDAAIRCARRGARASVVDRSPILCAEARTRARDLPIDVVEQDARTYLDLRAPRDLALAICLGGAHALGGLEPAARALGSTLAPGGALLLGDLVALAPEAAAAFDVPLHDEVRLGEVLHAHLVEPARVRAYEEAWTIAVERHLSAHPDDPAAPWARARLAWMRERCGALAHLAFGTWLLR